MVTPHSAWYRLRALVQPRATRADVDDELRFHLDMAAERLVRQGVPPDEAHARARREFGDVTRVREECVDEHGMRPLEDFSQDLRVGARILRRSPGLTSVSVLTLAVGIAAATTIFSVIDGVLLKPLPYEQSGRLVTVQQRTLSTGELDDASPANFIDWRERSRTLELLAAAVPYSMDHRTNDGMTSLPMWLVSSDFFELVGTAAALGRTFRPDEFTAGSDRVIVLGDAVWRERFAADPSIVGQTITLDAAPYTVVGVMPSSFRWPPGRDTWVPLTITDQQRTLRRGGWWEVLARVRAGSSIASAQREMDLIAADLAVAYPATNRDLGVTITPLEDALLGSSRAALAILGAAVFLLLLIACANVANIVLGRSIARTREFAIRGALGARPERLARQMITEVLVIALLGTALGVVLAIWGVDIVRATGPRDVPRIDELAIDGRVMLFAVLAALGVTTLAGVIPALWVARGNLNDALKEGGRTATSGPRARAVRTALAVGQVTLATMLLVGAGLLTRSLVSLLNVDRGYSTRDVAVGTVQAWQHYRDLARRAEFTRQAVERMRAVRGVLDVGVTSSLPLAEPIGADDADYLIEGSARPADGDWPDVHLAVVAGSYFEALRVPLVRGRLFDDRDRATTIPVAIVNATFARRHFGDNEPTGRRVTLRYMGAERVAEIVGVVGDMRHEGLHATPEPTVFLPHAQAPTGALTFVVRGENNALALRAIRTEITALNASLPLEDPGTLDALLDASLRERRFHLALLATFAGIAVLLAAVGVYGVMSHATAERTHEIGVRVALGAQIPAVVLTVMRTGLTLVGLGIVLGAIGAAAMSGALSDMLFAITAHDATTYVGVAVIMVVVSIVAIALPARRATRVPATEALRLG